MKSFPHLFNHFTVQWRTGDETEISSIHHWTSKHESTPRWWKCSNSIICLLCIHFFLTSWITTGIMLPVTVSRMLCIFSRL